MNNQPRGLAIKILLGVLALWLAGAPVAQAAASAAEPAVLTVIAISAFVRATPDNNGEVMGAVFKGNQVTVLGRNVQSSWLLVDLPKFGTKTWVAAIIGTLSVDVATVPVVASPASGAVAGAAAPAKVGNPAVQDAKIAQSAIYLRSAPATDSQRVKLLAKGAPVTAVGRSADSLWIQVTTKGSKDLLWVLARFVELPRAVTGLPQVGKAAVAVAATPPAAATPAAVVAAAPAATAAAPAAAAPAPVKIRSGSFELGGQVASFAYPDLMRQTGMTWVKRQVRWAPGAGAAGHAGTVTDAHSKGFKVLLSVLGDPQHTAPAYYAEYASFVGALAAFGADGIEVWNEMNLPREWLAGTISPVAYTEMLRQAHGAIKAANANTLVVSGAPSPTGYFGGCSTQGCDDAPYIAGMLAAGGLNYVDCIGVHYNEGIMPPAATSGDPRGSSGHYTRYYQGMVNQYRAASGQSRPLCFTEIGYLSGQEWGMVPGAFLWRAPYNNTVAEHAQYLADAVRLARRQGNVRLMIIFNVDFTYWADDPQAGFAMVRPTGDCPACTAVQQAMAGG